MSIKSLELILLLFLGSTILEAKPYTVNDVPNVLLSNANNFVSNPDHLISDNAEGAINGIIKTTQDSTTAQIAVVLLGSIGNEDIDNFATDLFVKWGIGKSKKDNGLLFLLVEDQHQMVFRTGYGLEGVLPDVILSRIIRNIIAPEMKAGNPDKAITDGITTVCKYMTDPSNVPEIKDESVNPKSLSPESFLKIYITVSLIITLVAFILLVKKMSEKKTNYAKYIQMSSVTGLVIACAVFFPVLMLVFLIVFLAYKSRLRNRPLICEKCGHKMHKLSEKEEDTYLNKSQQEEETLKSVDYDVWLCDNCHNLQILPYSKASRYSECPYCHARTYSMSDNYIETDPTPFSTGEGVKVYRCKNCGHKDLKRYIIPMIILPPTGRGGGGGFFGNGGGDGGSWGGGSTGGGGASGGW